ncbi:hypothetical protein T8K17_01745 [Thalassobaculum sp. OXR-137]|uniref:glycine-rich domain-containing protein n=1 Tax=Thalassobaculum sp. OXR-137 TaxID=3100173 RepID=UPI002AC8F032|nr:hypothetical protein [Thalassobaculum sp. OXR-137]WPZ34873.1 hypothetical protein T8K17_01745 [Thalassobaculum sp. OXR-137]
MRGAALATIAALLLVGGGGGGGGGSVDVGAIGAGGGGGEFLEITTPFTIQKGVDYPIRPGLGGRGGATTSAAGNVAQRGESGEATFAFRWAVNGGGGGGAPYTPGGAGTGNGSGFDGGSGGGCITGSSSSVKFNSASYGFGSTGPGGAGAGGTNGGGTAAGPGRSSSITGSPVTYAAGGQAGVTNGGPSFPGATNNSGNGGLGGGSTGYDDGQTGGSGVVIVRFLASEGTLVATGSFSVANDGLYKIVTFTGAGSFKLI